ncbi:MAG: kelch repeat-containing protein [Anaerolineae bacterium]|nr:kelch repeat-containing protein [Anaerolineae bacterium]
MPELGEPLSDRELDVLQCLAEGASNREIAQLLSISPNTVKVHVRNIYTKLGVGSRTEATTVALQQGAVSIPGIEVDAEPEEEEAGADEAAPEEASARGEGVTEVPARRPRPLGWIAAGLLVLVVIGVLALGRPLWGDVAATEEATPAGEVAPTTAPTAEPFSETSLSENWLLSRAMDTGRAGMAVASVGLEIYQIGGETEEGVDDRATIFHTQERRWREAAPKLTPVSDAAVGVLAGEIYVAGGQQANGQATAVVEAYSPLNDGWRPVAPLPEPAAAAVALVNAGLLYVIGGEAGGAALDSAYVYDPAQQAWRALPPLEEARAAAGAGVLNGELYVVGGHDGDTVLDSCERFDPLAERWESCPSLLQPRAGAGYGTFLNKLYLFGGVGDGALTGSEVFEAGSETWQELETPMLADVGAWNRPGVAVVETRLYVLGGELGETLSPDVYVYTPLVYRFFIPAASASGPTE